MKQRILSGLAITAMMAGLTGCDEVKFRGSLAVLEPMTFTQSRGPADGVRVVEMDLTKADGNVVLTPGQYPTKVTMGKSGKKKELTLEVSNASPATVIKMKFDKNIELGANFTLTAAQLGQNFDLNGNLLTNVTRTQEEYGWEHCTYQYPQTVCRSDVKSAGADAAAETATLDIARRGLGDSLENSEVPSVPNPEFTKNHPQYPDPGHYNNPHYTPVCHTVWVSRPGNMQVRFYYETTSRDITTKFVQAEKTLATYTGHSSETRKINTYQGTCH